MCDEKETILNVAKLRKSCTARAAGQGAAFYIIICSECVATFR